MLRRIGFGPEPPEGLWLLVLGQSLVTETPQNSRDLMGLSVEHPQPGLVS